MEEAYAFLAEQCCINIGIPAGEPEPGMNSSSAINGSMFCFHAPSASVLFVAEAEELTDEQLQYHLVTLLKSVNLDVSCQRRRPCFLLESPASHVSDLPRIARQANSWWLLNP